MDLEIFRDCTATPRLPFTWARICAKWDRRKTCYKGACADYVLEPAAGFPTCRVQQAFLESEDLSRMNNRVILSLCGFLYLWIRTLTLPLSADAACSFCGSSSFEVGTDDKVLQLIKSYILKQMHMKARPKTTNATLRKTQVSVLRKFHTDNSMKASAPDSPRTFQTLGHSQGLEDKSYEIITFAQSVHSNSSKIRLNFLLWDEPAQSTLTFIQQANLWLYLKLFPSPSNRRRQKVTLKILLKGPGGVNHTLISNQQFNIKRSSWHTFPVTHAIQSFSDREDKQFHFELECSGCTDAMGESMLLDVSSKGQKAFLVSQIRVSSESPHVRKRGIECMEKLNFCCRKTYFVDFRDIGWDDWIIMPHGYYANYCLGNCAPHMAGAPDFASSFHSIVTNLHKLNGYHPALAMNSCCIPTRKSLLSMLYFEEKGRIIKKDIPDMTVEECGCT
uniref:inhibin beta B chain-like n=1 Tax=Pristiophorus japonicus TaxID=55135 RepID=UPI00398F566E